MGVRGLRKRGWFIPESEPFTRARHRVAIFSSGGILRAARPLRPSSTTGYDPRAPVLERTPANPPSPDATLEPMPTADIGARTSHAGSAALLAFLLFVPACKSADTTDEGEPLSLVDPTDGQLDLSQYMKTRTGFLPIPIIITEPAVGYG